MDRNKVYEIIDNEREYQNCIHNIKTDRFHSVSDWIMFMEFHLNKAKQQIYNLDQEKAKEEIRKVTALGVACMEYNETKSRK